MAYVYEKPGSPYWWMGFVNEGGVQDQETACQLDGAKILVGIAPRELKQSRKDAEAAADRRERSARDVREGRAAPDVVSGFTFGMLAAKYEAEHASGLASEATIKSRMKHLVRHFGPRLLISVLPADIKAFTKRMLTQRTEVVEGISRSGELLSPASVEHLRRLLRAMFNFAKEANLVRSNPVLPTSQVDVPEVEIRTLNAEQVVLLLRHADQAWRAFIAVAVYCGLRKGEVIGLRVKNVDLAKGLITVAHSYGGRTKNGKTRVAPIPPELAPFLKVELGRVRSEYLFPNSKGKMWSKNTKTEEIIRKAAVAAGLVQGFDHLCRRKGCGFTERRADQAESRCPTCQMRLWVRPIPIDVKFKDTRSTCATTTYEATGDERFVTDLLGHQDSRVTDLYRKSRIAHLSKQGAKISYAVSDNPLTLGSTHDSGGAQVIRIPSSSRWDGECAMLDSNQRPLAPETAGGMFHPVAPAGISEQSLAVRLEPDSHQMVDGGTDCHPVSDNLLTLTGESLLTLREVAERLALPLSSVRRLIWSGKLGSKKVGNLVRVRPLDLAKFLGEGA